MKTNWSVGSLIRTRAVRKLHPEEQERLQYREQTSVYLNFKIEEQGKNRELVATFHGPDAVTNAAFATKAVNNYDVLLEIAKATVDLRMAQKAYMADRGNETLGKCVGAAALKVDEALEQLHSIRFPQIKKLGDQNGS